MDKQEMLTALQALSLYVLLRIDEGETDDNNFDYLLHTTVTVSKSSSETCELELIAVPRS